MGEAQHRRHYCFGPTVPSLVALGEEPQLRALVHSFFIRGGVSVATFMFLAGGKTMIFFSMQNVQRLPVL